MKANRQKSWMLAGAVLGLCTLAASAAGPIPFRGVVEGYYGRPWGTEGRISLMKFMGEQDMNTFIYGPKDDPYHHHRWREEYPTDQQEDFRKLLAVAKENKINFYWAIHLGGAFNNSEKDYAALFAKLESMYRIGIRAFAVFFDDYGGSDASGHAAICNRIINEFLEKKGDCAPLIMCPHSYWGTGDKYQRTLGEKLDPKAQIMWTGRGVCSNVRKEDVEKITAAFRRPPFVWWNWPVNDYCRRKLLLGRTYGCEPATYAGFVSNPMENCEANKIALYGVAAWCRDPEHFDSEANWNEAFAKLYSPKVAEAMKIFARHNSDQGPSGLHYRREESVGVTDWNAELKRIREAVKTLKAELPKENPRLLWEIEGWLDVQDYQAAIAELAFTLKGAKTEDEKKSIVREIVKLRELQTAAGEKAREKFRAATFERDRRKVGVPATATTVLEPMIRKAIFDTLQLPNDDPSAFSSVASVKDPTPTRDSKSIFFPRVQEQTTVNPGEAFGLRAPRAVGTSYIYAIFDSPAASAHGQIELSKDFGKTWQKIKTDNRGSEMKAALNPKNGWNAARYVNSSSEPVVLKISMFRFDVVSDANRLLVEYLGDARSH